MSTSRSAEHPSARDADNIVTDDPTLDELPEYSTLPGVRVPPGSRNPPKYVNWRPDEKSSKIYSTVRTFKDTDPEYLDHDSSLYRFYETVSNPGTHEEADEESQKARDYIERGCYHFLDDYRTDPEKDINDKKAYQGQFKHFVDRSMTLLVYMEYTSNIKGQPAKCQAQFVDEATLQVLKDIESRMEEENTKGCLVYTSNSLNDKKEEDGKLTATEFGKKVLSSIGSKNFKIKEARYYIQHTANIEESVMKKDELDKLTNSTQPDTMETPINDRHTLNDRARE